MEDKLSIELLRILTSSLLAGCILLLAQNLFKFHLKATGNVIATILTLIPTYYAFYHLKIPENLTKQVQIDTVKQTIIQPTIIRPAQEEIVSTSRATQHNGQFFEEANEENQEEVSDRMAKTEEGKDSGKSKLSSSNESHTTTLITHEKIVTQPVIYHQVVPIIVPQNQTTYSSSSGTNTNQKSSSNNDTYSTDDILGQHPESNTTSNENSNGGIGQKPPPKVPPIYENPKSNATIKNANGGFHPPPVSNSIGAIKELPKVEKQAPSGTQSNYSYSTDKKPIKTNTQNSGTLYTKPSLPQKTYKQQSTNQQPNSTYTTKKVITPNQPTPSSQKSKTKETLPVHDNNAPK